MAQVQGRGWWTGGGIHYAVFRLYFPNLFVVSLVKAVGPKLVPFLKSLGLYFVIFVPSERPCGLGILLKCLPVASLCLFVVLHGMSLGNEHAFARKVLVGLFFSAAGDALLVWPSYFLHGMAAFGIAQGFYTSAFGWEPRKWKLGGLLFAFLFGCLGIVFPGLDDPILFFAVPIYGSLLMTMVWRALARAHNEQKWTSVAGGIGAVFFAVSDTAIAVNRFYTEIPHSQAIVMVTYYLAQLGLALSCVPSKDSGSHQPSDESRPKIGYWRGSDEKTEPRPLDLHDPLERTKDSGKSLEVNEETLRGIPQGL